MSQWDQMFEPNLRIGLFDQIFKVKQLCHISSRIVMRTHYTFDYDSVGLVIASKIIIYQPIVNGAATLDRTTTAMTR